VKAVAIRRGLRAFSKLPYREQKDVLLAQIALVQAVLSVRLRKRGALVSVAKPLGSPPVEPHPEALNRAREIGRAVRRVALNGPLHFSCLERAIATRKLMEREHMFGAQVRVGIQLRDGKFAAHAWVEFAGARLIHTEAEVADFDELTDLAVDQST